MNRKIMIYSLVSFIAGAIVATIFGWSDGSAGLKSTVDSRSEVRCQLSDVGCSASASLMLVYGDGRVTVYKDLEVTEGETMMQLLEKTLKAATLNFTTKSYAGLGRLVDSIGDKRNGEGGQYWQFWVNNQYVPVGADAYVVQPGDVILWQFTKNKD